MWRRRSGTVVEGFAQNCRPILFATMLRDDGDMVAMVDAAATGHLGAAGLMARIPAATAISVCPETFAASSCHWCPPVIPAKAGIQGNRTDFRVALDPGFRRGDAIPLEIRNLISDRH